MSEIVSREDTDLPKLPPNYIKTLIAMILSKTDREAIEKCPYSEAHFYRLKPLLKKYESWLLGEALEETANVLTLLGPKAARKLGDHIDSRNESISLDAVKETFDRLRVGEKEKDSGVTVNVANVIGDQKGKYKLD